MNLNVGVVADIVDVMMVAFVVVVVVADIVVVVVVVVAAAAVVVVVAVVADVDNVAVVVVFVNQLTLLKIFSITQFYRKTESFECQINNWNQE